MSEWTGLKCRTCGGSWDEDMRGYRHQPKCPMARYEAAPRPCGAPTGTTGWICPKCGSGVSPWQSMCPLCGPTAGMPTKVPGVRDEPIASEEPSDDVSRT